MRHRLAFAAALLLCSACVPGPEGSRRLGPRNTNTTTDAGTTAASDAATDDGSATEDAGAAEDAGVAGDAGALDADATPVDRGSPPDSGPPQNCDFGFVLRGAACVPDAPEPFATRTEQELCTRWNMDRIYVDEWSPTPNSIDTCDRGTFSVEGRENALRRLNLYRWVAGLDPVLEDPARLDTQQACAVIQKAMGALSHQPAPDAPCYSPEGAQGAGSSNLALGATAAESVDLYVDDRGIFSLGHRRWVLNPFMGETTFGVVPPASCMYSFSMSGSGRFGTIVSWPPPGFAPVNGANGRWSFASSMYRVLQETTVEVAADGGPFVAIEADVLGGGFGWETYLAWDPPPNGWQPGHTFVVAIRGTSGGDFTYAVRTTACP